MRTSSKQSHEEAVSPHLTALDRIRVWHLLFGGLLVFLASGSVSAAVQGTFEAFQSFTVVAITWVVTVVGWFGWTVFYQGVSLTALFGQPPTRLRVWGLVALGFFASYLMGRADVNVILPLLKESGPVWIADWYSASIRQPAEEVPTIVRGVLVAVMFAGVFEEILFRGLIFQRWASAWDRPFGALLVTSLLFAVLHGTLLTPFVFAVAATLLYIQTRSLWTPIAMHVIQNGINLTNLDPAEAVLVPLGIAGRQEFGWTCFAVSVVLTTVLFWRCGRRLGDTLPYVANEDAS